MGTGGMSTPWADGCADGERCLMRSLFPSDASIRYWHSSCIEAAAAPWMEATVAPRGPTATLRPDRDHRPENDPRRRRRTVMTSAAINLVIEKKRERCCVCGRTLVVITRGDLNRSQEPSQPKTSTLQHSFYGSLYRPFSSGLPECNAPSLALHFGPSG